MQKDLQNHDASVPSKETTGGQSVCSTIGCLVLGASLKTDLIFLFARFRLYKRIMDQRPETVDRSIKATCELHNMLQKTQGSRQSSAADNHVEQDEDHVMCSLFSPCKSLEAIERRT